MTGTDRTTRATDGDSDGFVTDRRVTLLVTFLVAFCSIAYELVYSEFLTVFYGGTVLRYSITIGLYMFSLGVGAFLSRHLGDPASNFLRTELYLAAAGPLGAGLIVGVNAFPTVTFPGKATATLLVAHLPVLVVGLLSGFEIPLLDRLIDDDGSGLARLGVRPGRLVTRTLGVAFAVDRAEEDSLSAVLGVDYLGSLAGTVVYALVLYPELGLVVTVLVLGAVNAAAATLFAGWRYLDTRTVRPSVAGLRVVFVVGLLLAGTYGGLAANGEAVDDRVTGAYTAAEITGEYRPGTVTVDVRETSRTPYQRITLYDRRVAAHEGTERCLRLDAAIQLCDSWVESYHAGLVDVPVSAYENRSSLDVLLVGGGDFVAVDHLREYGADVDQVDIDGEFLRYAKRTDYLRQFHDGAYRYENLTTTVGDVFGYLRGTDERYDLILLDVPGARSDDSLGLYSTELYRSLRSHLTDRGVVVTWTYSKYAHPQHHKAYVNTVRAAGFDRYVPYSVYEDLDGDGEPERGERFYVLSDGPAPPPAPERVDEPYLARYADRLGPFEWRSLPVYRGVEPNSVFDPNYDIIVA